MSKKELDALLNKPFIKWPIVAAVFGTCFQLVGHALKVKGEHDSLVQLVETIHQDTQLIKSVIIKNMHVDSYSHMSGSVPYAMRYEMVSPETEID